MTDIKRKPRKRRPKSDYATYADARRNRRDFLRLLGKGLMMIPAAGLANACGVGRKQEGEDWGVAGGLEVPEVRSSPDAIQEPDYELAGGAPFDPDQYSQPEEIYTVPGDLEWEQDTSPEPEFISPGGPAEIDAKPEVLDQPDIKEEDWGLDGIIDDPDIHPEPEDVQEEDYWLAGGIGEPVD